VNSPPINDQTETWAGIRTEFTLPTLEQVRRRLSKLMEDPEPVMQQLVRVFIDEGTCTCAGQACSSIGCGRLGFPTCRGGSNTYKLTGGLTAI
jgi:hypothetical protein